MFVSDGLVEQHIHGAFGYDFMSCSAEEVLIVAELLSSCGVTAFFPTIMTDDLLVIKERIQIIKQAKQMQPENVAQIVGVHLEGPFINLEKLGIHSKKHVLPLKIDFFKQIEDEIIKIVTLAPELDIDCNFVDYLKSKGIKISVGHSVASDLSKADQVTHLYNAMGTFSHRDKSTVVSALTDDNMYVEVIADSMHVSDEVLKITFKQKSLDKILLISDALPLAHCDITEQKFAGETIYNKKGKLQNIDGIFAGSSMLLCDIVCNLANKNILKLEEAVSAASSNQLNYHNILNNLKVYWSDSNIIEKIEFI